MKPNLLIIGNPTPRMMDQLADRFVIHKLSEIDDPQTFLKANGDSIEGVATNGHDGVKPELMAALTNLKVISCFGVGYDGIDASNAAERGIVVTHTPNVLNDGPRRYLGALRQVENPGQRAPDPFHRE
jgi:lactate dehydrogenase-like 2-hydroxyacid dehydrogenase